MTINKIKPVVRLIVVKSKQFDKLKKKKPLEDKIIPCEQQRIEIDSPISTEMIGICFIVHKAQDVHHEDDSDD